MQKKVFLIVGVTIAVGTIAGGVFFYLSKQKAPTIISPENKTGETAQPTSSPVAAKLLLWNDPAGFTFQYPETVKINKHPEDKTNYANLDLYIDGNPGAVKILASDTTYKSAVEWATKDGGKEMTLSGKSARKITNSATGKIVVGIVDDNILFTIELVPDKEGKWQKTFDQVVSSFKFVYPTSAPAAGGNNAAGNGDITEEEIIE